MKTLLCVVACHLGLSGVIWADDWTVKYPPRFSEPTWLPSFGRLCFGVDDANLESVIRDGTNVICGGTNAAGVGFAGGPFILGKNGEILDIRSGVPVPEKTLLELRSRVDSAHAKGAKVLCAGDQDDS